ncbi:MULTISPECIES: hypothetical protein [unclassified Gluconobacter]|uniref:hypothetical protein n=1 Tax=unclassified Gluconobacter TaxID=2644261 RepID=UPI001C053774|nr:MULTISPECIES: hypothetical protein [unclassified Gluconobacter]
MYLELDARRPIESLYRQLTLVQVALNAVLCSADETTVQQFRTAMASVPAADPKLVKAASDWALGVDRTRASKVL